MYNSQKSLQEFNGKIATQKLSANNSGENFVQELNSLLISRKEYSINSADPSQANINISRQPKTRKVNVIDYS